MKLEHMWLNDMNLKKRNGSWVIAAGLWALHLWWNSNLLLIIKLCAQEISPCTIQENTLSHFHPLFIVITCWKWILLGTFFLPISDFAHHLHWQGLNPKFMGVIRNEWIIIVQINPGWSGGIVRYCGCRCLDSFSKYCLHPYFQIVHIYDKNMI